jgi:pimeloyl-ACP methyl ester carboxylesterase
MAYWEWAGPRPDAPVLVCVHGLSRQGRDFDALARTLSAHYRVICPDVVGRGESAGCAIRRATRSRPMWPTW